MPVLSTSSVWLAAWRGLVGAAAFLPLPCSKQFANMMAYGAFAAAAFRLAQLAPEPGQKLLPEAFAFYLFHDAVGIQSVFRVK